MAEYTGTFETGVSGNTVLNSDPGSANAWDATAFDAGGTLEYSNVQKYGSLSCRMVFSATPGTPFVEWTSATLGASLIEQWGRIYMWHTSLPGTLHEFVRGFDTGDTKWRIRILSSGVLRCTSSTDVDGTVSISTGQWIRVEWHVINSATVGFMEAKLFNNADSVTPDDTVTTAATLDTGTKTDLMRMGELTTLNPSTTVYMDNILVNDTGYPGPLSVPSVPDVLSMQSHVFGHNMW